MDLFSIWEINLNKLALYKVGVFFLNKHFTLNSYRIAPGQSDWINIDEKTGELRTNKVLETDRVGMKRGESNITVLAIDRSEYQML